MLRIAAPLALLIVPLCAAIVLLGPLRTKERETVLKAYAVFAFLTLVLAFVFTFLQPDQRLRIGAGVAALFLGPLTGLFVALRLQVVRDNLRAAFIFGPLGYLAGCGLALRLMVSLGFGF